MDGAPHLNLFSLVKHLSTQALVAIKQLKVLFGGFLGLQFLDKPFHPLINRHSNNFEYISLH